MDNLKETASVYDLKSIKLPVLRGFALKVFTRLLESPFKRILLPSLLKTAGITAFRAHYFNEAPTCTPILPHHHNGKQPSPISLNDLVQIATPGVNTFAPSVLDYAKAYKRGEITPLDVAEKVITAIENSNHLNPPMRAVIKYAVGEIRQQAQDSTLRHQQGKALSLFDGVPVAVKDEVDMAPFGTSVGTGFLGDSPCKEDATVVSKMRAAGALLIGKTNMHEIGIGVTGLNTHHGSPRNPYDTDRFTGGSSSGSATTVAMGIAPVAIGADGGGSIRIPAAFCGVVGLKPTYGRVSEHGAAPLCWSVAHIGPIASCASDAALAYAVMAGVDSQDPNSIFQPVANLDGWQQQDLTGVRLGVYHEWFNHADDEVVRICRKMLDQFKERGAQVIDIVIPDLDAARVAHTLIIASEMATAMGKHYQQSPRQFGIDARLNLAMAQDFSAKDYLKASQCRTRVINHFEEVFKQVDMIVTPTTAITAPKIQPGVITGGESDLTTLLEIMRFVTSSNLTGHPSISFPAGYSKQGLPVGLQAIGRAWQEKSLLQLALVAENFVAKKHPRVFYQILE